MTTMHVLIALLTVALLLPAAAYAVPYTESGSAKTIDELVKLADDSAPPPAEGTRYEVDTVGDSDCRADHLGIAGLLRPGPGGINFGASEPGNAPGLRGLGMGVVLVGVWLTVK